MKNRVSHFILFLTLLALTVRVSATPSGLNNIPTADTPPNNTLVLQGFTNYGRELDPDLTMGFKFGFDPFKNRVLLPRFEFGLDGHITPGKGGPLGGQVKAAVSLGEHLPAVAVGVANILFSSVDRDRGGQPFTYLVLTEDFGWLRGHAGYGFQRGNNSVLLGLDKTVKVFNRDLMVRGDLIQIHDQRDWLGSVGFLYSVCKYFAVEQWANLPSDGGKVSFISKIDVVIPF